MKNPTVNYTLLLLGVTAFAASAAPFDWPQWQGPERNAVSKETGLLKEWPKDGPPLAWKITGLGGGDSTPSIANGCIYGMSTRGEDEFVWALSEKDGKEIWAVKVAPAQRQNWPQSKEGPSATPTVDGDRLYVVGLAGNVACVQATDGKVLWQRSLVTDFGGSNPMWNFRESPLVDGDKVICTPGAQDAMLVALDKLTGATIWKSALPATGIETGAPSAPGGGGRGFGGRGGGGGGGGGNAGASYSSPIAIDFEGQRQYVQFISKGVIGSRRRTENSCGDMTVPPTVWASTFLRPSTMRAACSPLRRMAQAVVSSS